ncbi:MAG: glycosyltransferase family 2 protein [Actinomycetota bacterium]|nr:glycosyltransferase family 2 protein [Actinomycetota bacterium]
MTRRRAPFRPVRVLEVDLGALPRNDRTPAPGHDGDVLCLVRVHTRPLGQMRLAAGPDGLTGERLAGAARHRFGAELADHLTAHGCATPSPGQDQGRPACLATRDRLLADPPLVSVVIATRNRPDLLRRCLGSLRDLEYPRFEVVVVDNAASVPADRVVAEAAGAGLDVRYVREPVAGLARAHNRGVEEARGEIVAFVDDDVAVDGQWLSEIAAAFLDVPGAGCVTGMILPAELETVAQDRLHLHWGMNKGFRRRIFDFAGNSEVGRLHPYTAGQLGSGANMAFRVGALHGLGGFDVATGAGTRARGGDDLSAFFQVLAAGHRLVYEPAAIVHHSYHRDDRAVRRVAYGYGVGLGAYLAKTVIDEPGRVADVVPRLPAGVLRGLQMRRASAPGGARCPRHLVALERLGMLCGPMSYLASRRAERRPLATTRP